MNIVILILLLIIVITNQHKAPQNCLQVFYKNQCTICHQSVDPFKFKNCFRQYECLQYSSNLDERQTCLNFRKQYIPQSTCIQQCCDTVQNIFTTQNYNQCINFNPKNQSNKIVLICAVTIVLAIIVPLMIASTYKLVKRCKQNQIGEEENDKNTQKNSNSSSGKYQFQTIKWVPLDDNSLKQIQYVRQKQCAICLDTATNSLTSCGHRFHIKCLTLWIKKKQSCPLCVSSDYNPLCIQCQNCNKSQIKEINLTKKNCTSFLSLIYNQNLYCPECSTRKRQKENKIVNYFQNYFKEEQSNVQIRINQ